MSTVATTSDTAANVRGRASTRRGLVQLLLHKPLALLGMAYLLCITALVVFADQLAPYGPDDQDLGAVLQGPSAAHLLGTGELGRDILSRIMFGGRVTLVAMLIAVAVFVIVGVPLGVVAGYRGGRIDQLVLKTADISFSIPNFILLLVVLAIFPANEFLAMAVWGLIAAPGMARIVRSVTLGVREELYVRAALASGLRDLTILRRHLLPAVVGTAVIQATTFASGAIVTETGLGFLGLGTQGASWGNLVGEASRNVGTVPWLLVPSGGLIITFIIALNLFGDGLRDALAERHVPAAPRRRRPVRRGSEAISRPVTAGEATAPDRGATSASEGVLLDVRDLSVALPLDGIDTDVVRRVSFVVRPGEALGIVGESGCGKTITATSILGLLPAGGHVSRGTVVFDGLDLTELPEAELRKIRGGRIGWISQDPIASLDPLFTAGFQVAEAIRSHARCSRKEADRRVLELFAQVQLPDPQRVAKSYPHQLSGGMAQRVGIAAAIAGNPSLIIADEPTTALDVTVQAEILDVLRALQRSGTAVILITHDWGVLADLCEDAVVMYAGEVVERAPVAQLVARPAHPYTAAMLRSDPHRARPGQPLPVLDGMVPAPQDLPQGCHFQNRCALAVPRCRELAVPLEPVPGQDRVSRCIRTADVLEEQVA